MIENKVSLTITLPGGVMMSKDDCLKTVKKTVKQASKRLSRVITLKVEDWDKCNKHSLRVSAEGEGSEVITFYTRKCKPAKQVINLCKEAYDDMTSARCPSWASGKKWGQLSKTQRLEAHLQRIAANMGGVMASYQVFED